MLFQSAVGSLYLSTKTRPDIAYAVNSVARFCSKPTKVQWAADFKGTTTFGLLYQRSESSELIGFSDADWGVDAEDSNSTSGYCFENGGTIISWKSSKQTCVSLSTAEAEYVALLSAVQEAVWLRQLYKEFSGE